MATQQIADDVRVEIYRFFVEEGRAPVAAEIGDMLGAPQGDVEDALHSLAADRLVVLAPGTPYIWMANPFSALPTPYVVEAGSRRRFGTCIWEALRILAVVGSDGVVTTRCADGGDTMIVEVVEGDVGDASGVVHYAIPASKWWDDIGFN